MYKPTQQPSKKQICPECRGQGKVLHNDVWSWGWKTCKACNGSGFLEYATPSFAPRPMQQRNPLKFR